MYPSTGDSTSRLDLLRDRQGLRDHQDRAVGDVDRQDLLRDLHLGHRAHRERHHGLDLVQGLPNLLLSPGLGP